MALALACAIGFTLGTSAPAAAPSWETLEQRLVPEHHGASVAYHVETHAFDEEGRALDAGDLQDAPVWHFASGPALVAPDALVWWRCSAPPACAFDAEDDRLVFFTAFDPQSGFANAYDPSTRSVWIYLGTWTRWEDPALGLSVDLTREDDP